MRDDLVEAFDEYIKGFNRESAEFSAQALCRESSNLADFHPGLLWRLRSLEPQCQWEPRPLCLTRERHRNHGS